MPLKETHVSSDLHRSELGWLGWLCLCWFIPAFAAGAEPEKPVTAPPSSVPSWSARVDELLEKRMRESAIEPAAASSDVTFLRRVYLDLTGRNPSANEILSFQNDSDPHKREQVIDRLLDSPACAVHLANTWSAWLLPESDDLNIPNGRSGLHTWLRNRFADNLRYDRLVADLLVASGSINSGPATFFLSLESKPEKIAAKTARVFLGVQLDCAECHDHPFDHWKQRDFWGFAAYFARISTDSMQSPGSVPEVIDRSEGEVKLPGTEETIAPQPLVTTGLSGLSSGTRRQQLTLWLTARENPYLARAAVNRCWSLLFGRGLIEPIDDMRSLEMASHPEVLDEVARQFAASGYDLRALLRGLCNTRAYNRATAHPQGDAATNLYAAMLVKPLTSTQLATCMHQVARDIAGPRGQSQADQLATRLGKLRGDGSSAALGMVQALVTLHSEQVASVHREQSRMLQALTAPHLKAEQKIEWLFLCTVCREPRPDEMQYLLEVSAQEQAEAASQSPEIESPKSESADQASDSAATDSAAAESAPKSSAGDSPASQAPVSEARVSQVPQWQSDLLWALINSTEFAMTP